MGLRCVEATKTFTERIISTCVTRRCPRSDYDIRKTITQDVCISYSAKKDEPFLQAKLQEAVGRWNEIKQHLHFFPRWNTYVYPLKADGTLASADVQFSPL